MQEDRLRTLYQQQLEIFEIYNSDIRKAIVFIESSYHKFPVPFLNEIRAAQDHIARCVSYPLDSDDWDEYVSGQMDKARGHYTRCLLDCYKFIWYRYGRRLYWAHLVPKCFGKLRDIDNGEFYKEYRRLYRLAKDFNEKAREFERTDKERAKELYQDAIGSLKQMDNLFEDNYDKIGWSVTKGILWKGVLSIGWIISAIYFFVRNSDPIAKILGGIISFFSEIGNSAQ